MAICLRGKIGRWEDTAKGMQVEQREELGRKCEEEQEEERKINMRWRRWNGGYRRR